MTIDRRNLPLLRTIADYRVLTVRQLAEVMERPAKGLHRSVLRLVQDRLVAERSRGVSSGRGRREKLVSPTITGFEVLQTAGLLRPETKERDVTVDGLPHVEHQLLLNWIRMKWIRLDRACPILRTRFVTDSSPIASSVDDQGDPGAVPVPTIVRLNDRHTFTPDAIATITDVEPNKTVLFFLEVDMGTEPWDAAGKGRTTIMGKILNYQRTIRSEGHRVYASAWQCPIRGFRVLFLTNTRRRLEALCRWLSVIRPREFVWLTDQAQLLERGIGARIWARGGCLDRPAESILGSRADGV